ncbi:PREDICTED: uncharacterized protein LOC109208468 [Nicotiana attenuata]|uniref:uncharacterized protein LOC109208468 n=1 Tax=Nicotiana attenuata TaxID=49451 RepID=UPI0009046C64|nr:PREDICTED: uncharacterized protein LOC109208468 [Nicotiana attenuata]
MHKYHAYPQNASWMMRKILEAGEVISQLHKPLDDKKSIIKQIYLQLISTLSKTSWRRLMCNNTARPKAIFTMWLQCQGRLLTVDRLKKWGINVNDTCVLCQASLETRNHLFAECGYAKSLWSRLIQWAQLHNIRSSTWEQHLQVICQHTKGKSTTAKLLKMMYAKYTHALWKERNQRIFQETARDHTSLAREIVCICNPRAIGTVKKFVQQLYF